eukprot:gene33358-43126_t
MQQRFALAKNSDDTTRRDAPPIDISVTAPSVILQLHHHQWTRLGLELWHQAAGSYCFAKPCVVKPRPASSCNTIPSPDSVASRVRTNPVLPVARCNHAAPLAQRTRRDEVTQNSPITCQAVQSHSGQAAPISRRPKTFPRRRMLLQPVTQHHYLHQRSSCPATKPHPGSEHKHPAAQRTSSSHHAAPSPIHSTAFAAHRKPLPGHPARSNASPRTRHQAARRTYLPCLVANAAQSRPILTPHPLTKFHSHPHRCTLPRHPAVSTHQPPSTAKPRLFITLTQQAHTTYLPHLRNSPGERGGRHVADSAAAQPWWSPPLGSNQAKLVDATLLPNDKDTCPQHKS